MSSGQKSAPRGSANPGARGRTDESWRGAQEPTPAERIRTTRTGLGWSQSLLARLIARDGGTAGAWQQRLSEYETGRTVPDEKTLDRILATMGADAIGAARRGVHDALEAVLPGLVATSGPDAVAQALSEAAALVRSGWWR